MPTSLPLTGWPGIGWTAAYGGVPQVPDPTSSAGTAIGGNLGNLAQLYNLATGVGGASAAGARAQYQANLPMYESLTGARSRNIGFNLAGQVNPDVISLLAQQAAERGGGFGPDSPNANAAYLRALGQTSIGLQNLGQQQLGQAIASTPTGPAFDPSRFLVTPEMQQAAQYGANVLSAAPIPSAAATAGESAARRGIGAGMGAVPFIGSGARGALDTLGFPISQDLGWGAGGPPMVAAGGLGGGTQYGGQTYYGGATPGSELTNWQNWATGLPTGQANAGEDAWLDQFNWDFFDTEVGGGAGDQTQLGPVSDPWAGLPDIWGGDLGDLGG